MSAAKHLIYGYVDPRKGRLFYIGKSSSGLNGRPRRRHGRHCESKIIRLRKLGLEHEIISLEEFPNVSDEQARVVLNEAEIRLISLFRSLGHELTNKTNGGDGGRGCGFTSHWRGKKLSENHRAAISKGRKGIPISEEQKEKLRKSMIGKNTGKTHTPEERSRISARVKEQWKRAKENGQKTLR